MSDLKEKLIKIKKEILTIKSFKEKSNVEKYMLRKHEPKRIRNAVLYVKKHKD